MSSSPFIVEWVARLSRPSRLVNDVAPDGAAPPRALDVAMGGGRHALVLARAGFRTVGVDLRLDAVRDAMAAAAAAGLSLSGWCADLTRSPLPESRFDLVVVTRYLQRDLFPALRASVKPGGVVLYETFTTAQRALGNGPRSAEHLLEPGELRRQFEGFELLWDEELSAAEALARVAARRRS
jgi:tellurite methyltransferase